MRKCVPLYLLLALTSPLSATAAGPFDESLPRISWEDAADHYGERCIVYGTIVNARDIGSRCFLNFHADYRTSFTVVINRDSYANFPDPPDKMYRGKHVRVVGKVIEYRGKPEIIVESPEALETIDDPTPPASPPSEERGATAATPLPAAKAPPVRARAWTSPADGVIKIAAFNVLNLFDNIDDPYVEHEVYPGKKAEELEQLAATIRKLDADVLALQEVENRPFLEQFVASQLADMAYREVVLLNGNSDRGINVALLSRFPVGAVTSYRHRDFPDGNGKPMRFQRDLLRARITPEVLADFDVFVVHLKSKRGGPEKALPIRMGEAAAIRAIFDDILERDPGAAFVICGDFNDTFDSAPLRRIVGAGSAALRTFVSDLSSDERVTLKNWGSMVDFIFTSPAMGEMYQEGSYDVVVDAANTNGSDHNPVIASFKLASAPARN